MLIEVSDPDQGVVKFSVPLNSSIRFSPLYDPRNNVDEAKRGFKFDTVGDIFSAKVRLYTVHVLYSTCADTHNPMSRCSSKVDCT